MQLPRAEVLTYEVVTRRATEFLASHVSAQVIPVDVEHIVEHIGLDIVPVPSLKAARDVDGFLTMDMKEIRVDQDIMMTTEVRYRFTLAHELAHYVLHADAFREVELTDVDDWFRFHTSLENEWFEKQANWFAGSLLVPRAPLLVEYQAALAQAHLGGADVSDLSLHSRMTIAGAIADKFCVSAQVVNIRLEKLGLY